MSVLQRQHRIDDHLGRWTKALRWLHDLHVFEDFKTYMVKHKLYDDALRLYRYQEDRVKDIMGLYADHLLRESRYKDAGIGKDLLAVIKEVLTFSGQHMSSFAIMLLPQKPTDLPTCGRSLSLAPTLHY